MFTYLYFEFYSLNEHTHTHTYAHMYKLVIIYCFSLTVSVSMCRNKCLDSGTSNYSWPMTKLRQILQEINLPYSHPHPNLSNTHNVYVHIINCLCILLVLQLLNQRIQSEICHVYFSFFLCLIQIL